MSCHFGATLKPVQALAATLAPATPIPGPPGPSLPIAQQVDVTGSRSAGTVYRNAGSMPLFVSITWDLNGKNEGISAYSDANTPPNTLIASVVDPSNNGGVVQQMFLIVLPGNYYRCVVSSGAPSLVAWIEYQ